MFILSLEFVLTTGRRKGLELDAKAIYTLYRSSQTMLHFLLMKISLRNPLIFTFILCLMTHLVYAH